MSSNKRKIFAYKRATFIQDLGDPSITFETLLKSATKRVPQWIERMERPQDGGECRFLNYHLPHQNRGGGERIYGCEFIEFEEGADQSAFQADPGAAVVDVDAIHAPAGKEFVADAVYFGVIGNHVVMTNSRRLRPIELEAYINWLLRTKAKVLSEANYVGLSDHIPKSKKAMFKNVRGIDLAAPIHLVTPSLGAAAFPETPIKEKGSKTIPVQFGGRAWEAVKALVGEAFQIPTDFNVENLADAPSLEVKLFLRWKGRHHESDSEVLDGFANRLRHVDDEVDYWIRGKSGDLGRKDFKQKQGFNLRWTPKGRPYFEEIFPKMADWLAQLIDDGMVDP